MKTRTQAMLDWFHGRTDKPMPTPETDVGEAFRAGWDAREPEIEQLRTDLESARNNMQRVVNILTPLFVKAQEKPSPDEVLNAELFPG